MTELTLDMENVSTVVGVPNENQIRLWASAALSEIDKVLELSVRIVDKAESAELNKHYRHKTGPTNVLSFPAELPEELELPLLGDLVICAPVVEDEAAQQAKAIEAHWAHMVIHGCLHLIGYDHVKVNDAEIMETLETTLLISLGFPPPYEETLSKSN